MTEPQETDAHILLADISGYTRFLRENRTTLRHANFIISELLAAVMKRAEAPVRVEKLEGDAILFVAPAGHKADTDARVRSSMYGFFQAFYHRRAEMMVNNTCPCEACTMVDRLDLKVIDHYGQVLRHKVNAFEEVAGFDVIIAHRLMKNSVDASRYLLVTEAAWDRVKCDKHELPVERHVEACEGAGDVPVVVIKGEVTFPDERPLPSPLKTMLGQIGDFAIKHLMLLPFGERLVRRGIPNAHQHHHQ